MLIRVIDVETTGLDPAIHRVVEIATVNVILRPAGEVKQIVERGAMWSSLVNPERPIPPESSAIHDITDEMVKDAPRPRRTGASNSPPARPTATGRTAEMQNREPVDIIITGTRFRKIGNGMNPILIRILLFLALVLSAMIIILAIASVSHAAERSTWDAYSGQTSITVHLHRHHAIHSKHRKGVRPVGQAGRTGSSIRAIDVRPPGATAAIEPWKVELFRQFEDWLYFGTKVERGP